MLIFKGSMDSIMELNQHTSPYHRIWHVLRGSITLCPWWQRGKVTWGCHQVQRGRLLALWHKLGTMAQVLSLMATHSANHSDDSSSSQALRIKEKEVYAGSRWSSCVYTRIHRPKGAYAYTCTFMHRKACTVWKTWFWVLGIWTYGFGPWYLIRSVEPRYLDPGIGSKWFWTMVLSKS